MQRIEIPQGNNIEYADKLDYLLIASATEKCENSKKFKRWKILFATYSISTPKPEDMFPDSSRSYRIRETTDWQDVTLSIILGLTTTISRDTIIIDECKSSEMFLTGLASKIPENNALFQEKLAEAILDEKIQIKLSEMIVSKNNDEGSQSPSQLKEKMEPGMIKVFLKDGTLIRGIIKSQDAERVFLLESDNIDKEILKSEIQKIQFR
ncbi:hypothetical protein [Leptospira sp. GIMC2001]|uniref:hypothetical protein n=1 Tax=Leptospira sp. GIMC2001 TaxID=1513297 RepID=UPI00234AF0BA|nr:hypothetical protein [Leptospira sp. GIMC2001]WCL47735.1 hypothetical protein O4O04_00325 [Leptospira sp. GIMC2001]